MSKPTYPGSTDRYLERAGHRALNFLRTVVVNLDNVELTDEQFREFIRTPVEDMPGIDYIKPERTLPPESKL